LCSPCGAAAAALGGACAFAVGVRPTPHQAPDQQFVRVPSTP
jgi:hypothetical protein